MQTSKRLLVLNLSPLTKSIIRTVTTANASLKVDDVPLKSWKDIPGPSSWPIIGQIHHFLPGQPLGDVDTFQEKLYEAFGPIVRIEAMLGRPAMVFLYDAEEYANVLRGENWMPVRPGFFSLAHYRKHHNKTKEESKMITGLITDHNDNWREFRSKVNPVMMQPKTIRLYSTAVEEVADDMIKRMRSIRNEKNMLNTDFNTEMNLWSLESIGVIALGGRLNCFDPNLADDSPERRLIRCVHDIFRVSNELDFGLSLWRYFSTKAFKDAMMLYEEQENLAKHFIKKAQKEMLHTKKSEDQKGILEKLLDINERVAIIMASDMLFAGVDTAATTVTSVLYHLATNQEKQNILREKLASDSKYLKACVKESMRLLPVVAGNAREATKDHSVLGYKIPKGIHVIFNHPITSRMENEYPKAMEYIPERWIEEGPLYHKNAHPFSTMPFGFGVRMCIGRRIAELEIETFVAKVIQNFKVEWFGPPPKIKQQSLNYFQPPFNFVFKDVK